MVMGKRKMKKHKENPLCPRYMRLTRLVDQEGKTANGDS